MIKIAVKLGVVNFENRNHKSKLNYIAQTSLKLFEAYFVIFVGRLIADINHEKNSAVFHSICINYTVFVYEPS